MRVTKPVTRPAIVRLISAALLAGAGVPAYAQSLPEPVRLMIEAAADTGDARKLDAVVEAARAAYPGQASAIDEALAQGRAHQAQLATVREAQERAAVRQAGLFERWDGRGQIGGFRSTGNTQNAGLTIALELDRSGDAWSHKIRARTDFQRSEGRTTREQYLFSWEPRYQINPRLFAYALGQWEKDEFRGFEQRLAVSGGVGYRVLDREGLQLSLKAGPAWRQTITTDDRTERSIAALAGIDFDWQIADTIKLTQDSDFVAEGGGGATAIIGGDTTTINLVTGLEAEIIAELSARLSYAIEYDSNPPAGAERTDTLSRFTLIYDF